MKNECEKSILKLIPSRMLWCDRDSLQNLLTSEGYDPFEVGRAIRYLAQKRLLVQLVVNLPNRVAITKSYGSELGAPDPVRISSHVSSYRNSISAPIEMLGATKRWAGICGCTYDYPNCQADWIAHLRFSVAFSNFRFRKEQSDDSRLQTTRTVRTRSLLYASVDNCLLAVPLRLGEKVIRQIADRLVSKGSEYEIW